MSLPEITETSTEVILLDENSLFNSAFVLLTVYSLWGKSSYLGLSNGFISVVKGL